MQVLKEIIFQDPGQGRKVQKTKKEWGQEQGRGGEVEGGE